MGHLKDCCCRKLYRCIQMDGLLLDEEDYVLHHTSLPILKGKAITRSRWRVVLAVLDNTALLLYSYRLPIQNYDR